MTRSGINRPFKYGERDRREFIVQDSETALRAQNDANGNPVYLGRAKVGILNGEVKWQIRFIEYDGNQGVTSITWPENSEGHASSEYEFEWDERASYTYS
jgi:hypothetical protein